MGLVDFPLAPGSEIGPDLRGSTLATMPARPAMRTNGYSQPQSLHQVALQRAIRTFHAGPGLT